MGVPNVYNSIDVLLKVDFDPGLTFPILEACACQTPFVSTFVGIEDQFDDAGIVIYPDEADNTGNGRGWYVYHIPEVIERARKAIIFMRDHKEEREKMGIKGRTKILVNYSWDQQIPKWEEFFDTALKMAEEAKK